MRDFAEALVAAILIVCIVIWTVKIVVEVLR
jgi:hypothetical protein